MRLNGVRGAGWRLLLAGLLTSQAGCGYLVGAAFIAGEAIESNQREQERQALVAQQAKAEQARAARARAEEARRNAPIEKVELSPADGRAVYCAGGAAPKLRLAVTKAGERLESTHGDNSESLFSLVQWSASSGRINKLGYLEMPADSLQAVQQEVTLTAAAEGRPEVSARVTLQPDFACERTVNFRGEPGEHGDSGEQGGWGYNGSQGNPHGGMGGMGGPGGPGGPGGDALPVEVALAYVSSPRYGKQVLARVEQVGGPKKAWYLLDPAGPPLTVDVSGGSGGAGGSGGQGGSGGFGYSENTVGYCCNGPGGDGGPGGNGGVGGNGGRGGVVTVKFDSRFPELRERVRIVNGPGPGGEAGWAGGAGYPGPGGSGSQGPSVSGGHFGQEGHGGPRGRAGLAGLAPRFVADSGMRLFADEAKQGVALAR